MYRTHNLIEALCWGRVLEVARVGNLPRCPLALVVWVVNQRSKPFALVKRVRLVRAAKTGMRGSVIGEKSNSFTASTRRNQEPRRTWGSEQSEGPSRRLPHHPTLRASQHLNGEHKNISKNTTNSPESTHRDRGQSRLHHRANLQVSPHPHRGFHRADPRPSHRASWHRDQGCVGHQPNPRASCPRDRLSLLEG